MADRIDVKTAAPHRSRWMRLVLRTTTPALVYRLAGWRRSTAIGKGRLVVRGHRRGGAELRYRNPDGEDRSACLCRQRWALGVLASCGASRGTLREMRCQAWGDEACEYLLTWAERARPAPVAVAGMLTAAALVPTALPDATPAAWLLVPVTMLTSYVLEHRRAVRTRPPAHEQSGAVFRQVVACVHPREETLEPSDIRAVDLETPPPGHESVARPCVTLEQEGDFWRIGYAGTSVLLRHSRGLALLAQLVRNPGQEIHVSALDAITPSGGSAVARKAPAPEDGMPPAPGDAGEVLDAQARAEYRHRVIELREELTEARARHDLGRVERLRAELQLLEDELRTAVSPRRRARRAARDTERLRVAITHRIRSAVLQIGRHHPALGDHLAASVSTGYRCVYRVGGPAGNE